METVEQLLVAWWKDQWDAKPVDALIAARTENGAPSIDETEVAIMRAAEELVSGQRKPAADICEQIASNLRTNAASVMSDSLRKELENCSETADQCALSIRHGRPITFADKSIKPRTAG